MPPANIDATTFGITCVAENLDSAKEFYISSPWVVRKSFRKWFVRVPTLTSPFGQTLLEIRCSSKSRKAPQQP